MKETNRVVKMAQAGKDEPLRFTRLTDDPSKLLLLVYHDAAWANVQPDPVVEPHEADDAQGQGVYSQLGHVMLMTTRDALEGVRCPSMVVGWKSQACPRVCRSTFAAAGALRPGVATTREEMSRDLFPIVSVTDCKSLYDNVHRVGGPRAPTEKAPPSRFDCFKAHGQRRIPEVGPRTTWCKDPSLGAN